MHALQRPGVHEVGDRLPDGDPADPEPDDQGALGGDRVTRVQLGVDQLLEDAPDLGALGGGGDEGAFEPVGPDLATTELVLQCCSSTRVDLRR